ncbi:MAG: rhomboid family intramembrane serine protease, partial [Acidobacteriota bacterium]|nr:rhomboid family intramembrane serine protease [Acidobacteriota bacterium]
DPTPERFPLRPPRDPFAGVRRGIFHAVAAWILLLFILDSSGDQPLATQGGLDTLLYSLGAAAAWGLIMFLTYKQPTRLPPIELHHDGVRGPFIGSAGKGQSALRRVPYSQLRVAHCWRQQGEHRLILGVEGAPATGLPGRFFKDPEAPRRIADSIRQRIADLPGGEEQLAAMDRRAALAERIQKTPIPATLATSALLVLLFAIQVVSGGLFNPILSLGLGANSSTLVGAGQWQRLITANLLHGGLLHLGLNVWGLVLLGRLLEPLLGSWRWLAYFCLSCVAGAAASTWITQPWLSLGASTGLAGLLGVYTVFIWRRREDFPTAPSKLFWILLPAAFLLPALFFNVDHAAHAGGFLAGALLGALALGEPNLLHLRQRNRQGMAVLGAGLAIFFLGVQGWTLARFFTATPEQRAAMEMAVLDNPDTPPQIVNFAAWTSAIRPEATETELRASRDALSRALEQLKASAQEAGSGADGEVELQDTLATLHYRLGDFDRAAELERPLAERRDERSAFYRSQLARFELARVREQGPWLELPPGSSAPRCELQITNGERQATLVVPADLAGNALLVRGVILDGEAILGQFTARSGRWAAGANLSPPLPAYLETASDVQLLTVERPERTPGPEASWSFEATDPEVAELPGPGTSRPEAPSERPRQPTRRSP